MSNIRLRYIRGWVDKKTGKAYWRFRRRGYKEVTLPGLPSSREFMAAYQQALDQPQIPIGAKRTRAGTVNAALVGYYDSTMFFGSLAPGTQAVRRGILERFRAEHGDKPIAELPPKFITLTLNKLRPSVARNWFKAIRHLMQYAVAADLCPSGIDRVRRKLDVGWSGESHGGCRHEVPPRMFFVSQADTRCARSSAVDDRRFPFLPFRYLIQFR
jgi:hypothetical protein